MLFEFPGSGDNPFLNKIHPNNRTSIRNSLNEQIQLEQSLSFDENESAPVGLIEENKVNFCLHSQSAEFGAIGFANLLKGFKIKLDNSSLIDVGGAKPYFLESLAKYTGSLFNATFTSLTDFGSDQASAFSFRQMAAEAPPPEYYRNFDFVCSVNGPLVWTEFPTIVLSNLIDMVKPNGGLFLGINQNVSKRNFHPFSLIKSNKRTGFINPFFIEDRANNYLYEYIFAGIKK